MDRKWAFLHEATRKQPAKALCIHDEGRRVGGLLHLRFKGGTGRPSDVTDNTLSSVLEVLDRFKRAVVGNSAKRDDVQARIIAHALPPTDSNEPSASLVDLIKADFADGTIACGTQTLRRVEPVCRAAGSCGDRRLGTVVPPGSPFFSEAG